MRRFESQIRVHKWAVDEVQRQVADLIRLAERLQDDRSRLEAEMAEEQTKAASSFEAGLTYPAFAIRMKERREKLDESIAEVSAQLTRARDQLAEAFGELKKFELAADAAALREQRRLDKREQQTQDELGLEIYRRQVG